MAPIKVYGSKLSSNAMRVFACLYEKDLDFEFVPVNMGAADHKKEPFISLSPFGQVPAFEDGDLKLFESRAITKYISHTYADMGNQLIFQEPKKMAELLVWMEVEAHQFNSAAAKLGWELAFKPMFGLTTDNAAVEENLVKLGKVLDIYEARLSQSKYMVGNSFSLVDLHHLPNIKYLMDTRASEVFNSRPHVSAWCADIQARPAWKKVINM